MDVSTTEHEKKFAALASVGSAIVLVCLKIFLVVATGSLGVLSEALHSSLDLIAALITYLSVRVSDRPADARHPYGHAKFESFSAFVETALLLVTAIYIIYEAIRRLFFLDVQIRPTFLAIGLLGSSALRRPGALARAWPRCAEIFQRSAGSRRTPFFNGRVEHADRHARHGRRAHWIALRDSLASIRGSDRSVGRGGICDLGWIAPWNAHAGIAG